MTPTRAVTSLDAPLDVELDVEAKGARLAQLEHLLATFPESVAPVSYALTGPPPLAPLAALLAYPIPILERFVKRLKAARPDLTEGELLSLSVPITAGDREVYLARLGKWQFEARLLQRELAALGE